jgi:hypothetical protein
MQQYNFLLSILQVFYTLDLSQYALDTPYSEEDNFYHCINKALQKREPQLLGKLSGQVVILQSHILGSYIALDQQ